jgi:hypothetical protein
LRHFLDNSGKDYVPTEDDIKEVSKESDKMIKNVLKSLAQDKAGPARDALTVGTTLSYEGHVRWVASWSAVGLGDRALADERFVDSNDYMFYAYAGADLKLIGKVTGFKRKAYRDQDSVDVKADVTLSDVYDFAQTGPLKVRLLFEAYEAANFLQTKAGYKPFAHTLTFTKDYTFYIGVARLGPK